MEVLAAVGLASNIVQFISFTRELFSASAKIAHTADGALVGNLEIEAVVRNLGDLSASLNARPSNAHTTDPALAKEQKALEQLCEGCKNIADLLIVKLTSLKAARSGGKIGKHWTNFRQALKNVLAAEDIQDLETRLDRYQKAISITLLASLRLQINQAEKSREARHASMSSQLLGFIDATKTWQADLIDTLHQNDWRPDKAHDVENFAQHLSTGAQIDKETLCKRRIYSLLQFDEIADRHEAITEAHKKTFEWVFHRSRPGHQQQLGLFNEPGHEPQWASFIDWLRGNERLYWITGKPGSGKSTLMKFLYNHAQTQSCAASWSRRSELFTAGWFFWNSGSAMQMSRMGLLQALLYQCLKKREDLIPTLFPTRWTRHTLFGGDSRPWTWLELKAALRDLLSMKGFRFLFFIDGLDEFDGNPEDLVSLVMEMMNISQDKIKLCVASRPWLVFEEAFGRMSWLRMEDLTKQDIQLYVQENMQDSMRWKELKRFMPNETEALTREITARAAGVFLWVVLVVASLLGGLRDGDTVEDLWRRVNELPTSLEQLFQKILGDLNPRYFKQGCELFQLVFTALDPLTLLEVSLALDGYSAATNAPLGPNVNKEELSFRAETIRRRIISRAKGLLEVPKVDILHERAKVEYLHRTVRDFFKSEQAWAFVRAGAPDFDASLMLAAAFLRLVKLTPVECRDTVWDEFWRSFTYCVEYVRGRDVDCQYGIHILTELEKTANAYWRQAPDGDRCGTWLAKLVSSTPRIGAMAWTVALRTVPQKKSIAADPYSLEPWVACSRRRTWEELPHWTNTIYLADISGMQHGKRMLGECHDVIFTSFFDFAFVLRLDGYTLSTLASGGGCCHLIGNKSPLARALLGKPNFTLARAVLETGADPNSQVGTGEPRTTWRWLLDFCQTCKDDKEKTEASLLAASFLEHGADLTIVRTEDFKYAFCHMEPQEKEALTEKVDACRRTKGKRVHKAAVHTQMNYYRTDETVVDPKHPDIRPNETVLQQKPSDIRPRTGFRQSLKRLFKK